MTKWEYCAIGPLGADLGPIRTNLNNIYILFITKNGIVKRGLKQIDSNHQNYIAKIIANLGEDGWELVCSGTGLASANMGTALIGGGLLESHMLYFKRSLE